MWIVELNIAGFKFTRQLPDLPRRRFRLSPRHVHWPLPRHSHAA